MATAITQPTGGKGEEGGDEKLQPMDSCYTLPGAHE